MSNERSEDFIDIYALGFHLWSKWKWIFLAGVLGGLGGGLYGLFGPPVYQSRVLLAPNAPSSSVSDFLSTLPVMGGGGTGTAILEARLSSRSISERVAVLEPGLAAKIFPDRWDAEAQKWMSGSSPSPVSVGSRLRRDHVSVTSNARQGLVDLRFSFSDSLYVKRMADAYLKALKASIQENLYKDLQESRVFLEEQARQTTDPQILLMIQEMLARNVQRATFNNPADFQVIEYPSFPVGETGPKPIKSAVLYGVLIAAGALLILAVRYILITALAERRKKASGELTVPT